ncbi:proline--tRNA ligase, partial [bacterium]|nr:proline--tRNA ligase [bacterium]
SLFDRALAMRTEKTVEANTWDEFVAAIEVGQFVLAHWSGDADVEAQIKEKTNATIRCIPFDQKAEDGACVLSGKPSKGRVLFARAY